MSTLPLMRNRFTTCQCSNKNVQFSYPKALKAFNQFMGYVDLVDFNNMFRGSFALFSQEELQKWNKKGLLGILDFMLVHGEVVWYIQADITGNMWGT